MSSPPRSLGNYDLGALLGRGGMSEVYEARHRFLGDAVAIKLLRSHLASDPRAIDAFVAEAARTRTVVHPNVVQVRDFGHDAGAFYLVMERLEGETLRALLERGPLSEERARELGSAIADGVAAAHAQGVVHRDLKPGNVMIVDGVPKIVDFGIARYFGGDEPLSTGTRIGTPAYMAPEQLAGGLIAPCIDVWALGVVLYEMVTGSVPFDTSRGASPQLVAPAPRLRAPISAAYAAVVAACLEREPGGRPRAIADVARALRAAAGDGERLTEDLGEAPPPTAPERRRRWIAPVAAIALGIAGAVAWRALDRSSSQAPVAPAPSIPAPVAPAPSIPAAVASPPPAAAAPEPAAPAPEPAAPAPEPAGVATPAPAVPAPTAKRRKHAHRSHRGSASAARAGETLD